MWEFIKKHKLAVFGSLGILLLLYLYYKYESAQSASAATNPNDLASALTAASLPSLYGGSGGSLGPISSGSSGVPLGNFLNTPSATSNPTDGTGSPTSTVPSSTGVPSAGPAVIPGTSGSGLPNGSAFVTNNPATAPLSGAALTAQAQQALTAGTCQYNIGQTPNGVPFCAPGVISGSGPPQVNGLLPGQAGYTSSLEAEISSIQGSDPAAAASLQQLLAQYGGLDAAPETVTTPAGANQTATPVSSSTYTRTVGTVTPSSGSLLNPHPNIPTLPGAVTNRPGSGLPNVLLTGSGAPGAFPVGPAIGKVPVTTIGGVGPTPPAVKPRPIRGRIM